MARRPKRIAATSTKPTIKAWAWPCGCVTLNSRTGPLDRDCGDPSCYRRTRPATTRVVRP